MHCDNRVHFSGDLSLSNVLGTLTPKHVHLLPAVFYSSTWKTNGVSMRKLGVISPERLKVEVKLLLSANRKSYAAWIKSFNRLSQQRMTLCDLEWPFHASRAISAAAELLVKYVIIRVLFPKCMAPLIHTKQQ